MKRKNRRRFRQTVKVLLKHKITKGITPEKLRSIFETLGPTYVKIGQILSTRPDLLPTEYCEELKRLRENVSPMEYNIIEEIITSNLALPIEKIFSYIDSTPLGSASIGQVHKGRLISGEEVVIKVMRPGIYELVKSDIDMLKDVVRYLKIIPNIEDLIDFNMLLDEAWQVMSLEMNFLNEASNLKVMTDLYQDCHYVAFPKVYEEYTTMHILVMEYIDGIRLDNKEALIAQGYDLKEICAKLIDNYIVQIIENGLFHADPHPGNVLIRDGQIVWLDLGMLGVVTKRDRSLYKRGIKCILNNDIYGLKNVVITMGVIRKDINHAKLYKDLELVVLKYMSMDIAHMDMGLIFEEITTVARSNGISAASSMVFLGRGIIIVQSLVAMLDEEANLLVFFSNYMKENLYKEIDPKQESFKIAKKIYNSVSKSVEIPSQIYDLLNLTVKGQSHLNIEVTNIKEGVKSVNRLANKLTMGVIVASFSLAIAILLGVLIIMTNNIFYKVVAIIMSCFGLFTIIIIAILLLVMMYRDLKK